MDKQPLNTCEQKDMTEFFTDLISKLEEMGPELVRTILEITIFFRNFEAETFQDIFVPSSTANYENKFIFLDTTYVIYLKSKMFIY